MSGRLVLVALLTAPIALAGQQAAFRSAVDSVEVDVSVTSGGHPVAGLTAADFVLTDQGVPQSIVDVSREALPIDLTLVIDVSGSVEGALVTSLLRAVDRVAATLRPIDRVGLVTFNQQVRERVALASAASKPLAVGLGRATGPTSLYDAIAVSLVAEQAPGRRHAAIVFTDGLDTTSVLDEETVVQVAKRSDMALFVVASADRPEDVPAPFFKRLAEVTGGVARIVPGPFAKSRRLDSPDSIDASFLSALDDFRTSYVLRYAVQGVPRAGWHELSVRLAKPGAYEVRARKGYFGTLAGSR